MLIWISGPTGAGKSSLCETFRTRGYGVVAESLPKSTFAAFRSDPIRHCAELQEQIMRSRFKAWQELMQTSRVVFDRSLDEDACVFCKMHHESGFLDNDQYERLRDLARILQHSMPLPDPVLFVSAEKRILSRRLQQLKQPPLIVQNLDRQVSLYDEWVAGRCEEVLKLDNSACKLQTVRQLFLEAPQC
jgi:deoxyadenosine/deoxycytidine kinase